MNTFCKALTYILVTSCLISCDKVGKKKKDPLTFYYTGSKIPKYNIVSITAKEIKRHDPNDSLLSYLNFNVNNTNHIINMYTSDFRDVAMDSGALLYELDSLGVIYGRSTTWFNYRRLHSNNDSINEIIDVALEHIILRPQLHCYLCRLYSDAH
ncbi:hypothetical protein [Hymenobacter sp. HDW8]|uniref:hypothetical protein n=1 Tax=Hymenobacter sp. HDW8 TaxID=2714932 RepID=UPI00140BD87E|nr:hypothetical protein [Hymenobacter sp. HDW8]QIL74869.1 hypothetical protein G7064_02600 [Hymenobacter sp. HDW8]